jgi:Mn-dependent DtxR family transcriptional regulator
MRGKIERLPEVLWFIYDYIVQNSKPPTNRAVAAFLDINEGGCTRKVSSMARQGYVNRVSRSSKWPRGIYLTPKAFDVLREEDRDIYDEVVQEMIDD